MRLTHFRKDIISTYREYMDTPIDIVMRQTDYTKEIASEKLITHKNDIFSVIREWQAGPQIQTESCSTSTSQLIYKEIRNMMGNAAANYRRKKEMEQYISILQQAKQQEQQQQVQEQANQQEQAKQQNLPSIKE
jgi:aspartate oxidase